MEPLLKGLEHAPALAAMLILVFIFVKALDKILASHATRTTEFINAVKDLNRENIEARVRSNVVIEENTKAAAESTVAMNEMTGVMREFSRK